MHKKDVLYLTNGKKLDLAKVPIYQPKKLELSDLPECSKMPLEDLGFCKYHDGSQIAVGDVIDINQTVNGTSHFKVFMDDDLKVYAKYWESHCEGDLYEYDVAELLGMREMERYGETEIRQVSREVDEEEI